MQKNNKTERGVWAWFCCFQCAGRAALKLLPRVTKTCAQLLQRVLGAVDLFGLLVTNIGR